MIGYVAAVADLPPDGARTRYSLRLYVTGRAANSVRAINNLESLRRAFGEDCDIQVIDVAQEPRMAEEDRILATPTLVKREPPPVRKIIGDLSDPEKVLLSLDLEDLDVIR